MSDFDPSADYIQPTSRVHLRLSLPAGRKKRVSRSPSAILISEDSSLSESEGEGELEDGSYSDPSVDVGRSTRHRASRTVFPYSPKKTRSKGIRIDSEAESSPGPDVELRRSTRARKSLRDHLAEDDFYEGSSKSRPDKAPPKKARNPVSRPAYGRVRPIGDIDYDSDDETTPLRKHRNVCESCHRAPTHKLLSSMQKKKRKRARKSDDESESDDNDKLAALGGWVQWYVAS